jgi:hypothetical protein
MENHMYGKQSNGFVTKCGIANDKITINKYKGKNLTKCLTIKEFNKSEENITKIIDLQEKIFNKLIDDGNTDFLAKRTKEMYKEFEGTIIGIFDGEALVGQAMLGSKKVTKFPKNEFLSNRLGKPGYEMGGVMVDADYSGNKLCEKLINFASNLANKKNADFILYNVQYSNFASMIPALKQKESFVGECSEASVDEYFKTFEATPCEEQKGMTIRDVSIFIPIKNKFIVPSLQSTKETKKISLKDFEKIKFSEIEKYIEQKHYFVLNGEGEKRELSVRQNVSEVKKYKSLCFPF